jgi:hypothetical protein
MNDAIFSRGFQRFGDLFNVGERAPTGSPASKRKK